MEDKKAVGKITEIKGPVIDARFEKGSMPKVNDALRIEREGEKDLVLEVAQHLGDDVVRAIAMDSTDG
ncbi:F0F1 ATP synthase subunit beta, partial [Candidatus Bipolaricaulota bacterium]|nr:F0F1 ATP synthase subunit beta [Candidatus Bipolaricaulota bacterium]